MTNKTWSGQQEEIFGWFANDKGNLVVRARAGTGKTTTIIEGVSRAKEGSILLCAFNKKIADELSQRIKNPNAVAKTLHSVGVSFVFRNWKGCQVDDSRGGKIAQAVCGSDTPDEIVRLVTRLAARCKSTMPFPASVEDVMDEAVDADLEPDEEFGEGGWDTRFVAQKTMAALDRACVKDGTIDFDDMVFVPLRNKWVTGKYDLVVVDEAQDMSVAQLLLAQKVCKRSGRIAVVGDDCQAIYGFRGADSGSLDRLKAALKAKELGLTVTYRCGKNIVDLAKQIVPDYEAAPGAHEGSIESIERPKLVEAAQPSDFILSRKNAPLAGVCLSLLRAGKRAKIEGKEVGATLISLVKKIKGKSIPDFITRLQKWADREVKRAGRLEEKKRETKVNLVLDQKETLLALVDGLSGVPELVARIESLFADVAKTGMNFIVCSSVHRAKGLERDNVFLIEETFNDRNVEERNIKYVAITRAKNRLIWVKA
jgi:DNA helicase-2/ATP-dependent DNA helicase PcrA